MEDNYILIPHFGYSLRLQCLFNILANPKFKIVVFDKLLNTYNTVVS